MAEEVETLLQEDADNGFVARAKRAVRGDPKPKPGGAEVKPKDKLPAGHPNKQEVAEIVAVVNLPIALLSPRDTLTEAEQVKLIAGLDTYCKTSEQARRALYAIVRRSALIALLDIGLSLALPRMIRHGLLPVAIAPYVQPLCDPFQLADACGLNVTPPEWSPNGHAPTADARPADIPAR